MVTRAYPRRSWLRRLLGWIIKGLLLLLGVRVLWVLLDRFVNGLWIFTHLGDLFSGNGLRREWMAIETIDRNTVRVVIAGEDSKYCSHDGFDRQTIEEARRRSAPFIRRDGMACRAGRSR